MIIEEFSIINDRCNYLRKIKSFREAGYDIVCMDETWVNQNHCTDYMWLPNDGSDAPKIPSGKGKRLIVLHAVTRSEGLIDQGQIQDFKSGGAHLKKLRRAEGGAKIFGVFRVKNHGFTSTNHIFSNFRVGARAGVPSPWIRRWDINSETY